MSRLAGYALFVFMTVFAGAAAAQSWSAEQQEIWRLEEAQWKMAADKDMSWIDKYVHANLSYWENDQQMPQNKASLVRWSRYGNTMGTVLEQEIYPISIVVTGHLAVINYRYTIARENYKKERETVHGRYTDVMLKDGAQWKFITWSGGDDPKK